jgi:hypothetical protein
MFKRMEAVAVALLIAFPLAGALIRRWHAVVLPIVGWPLFYLGLHEGWWGNGLGEASQYPARVLLVVGVVTTAIHVAVAKRVRPRSTSRRGTFA